MLNVLHLIGSFNTGGIQKYVLQHINSENLNQFNHSVVSTILHDGNFKVEYEKNNIYIEHLPFTYLPKKYIFCGTNTCAHKNLNPLFAALYLLKKEDIFINLILTGPGTEIINGKSSEYGVELTFENREIFGLGYVKNNELDQIIKNCDILDQETIIR